MVYTKVTGSKQTVLGSSGQKKIIITGVQPVASPPVKQLKQTTLATTKTTSGTKVTIKSSPGASQSGKPLILSKPSPSGRKSDVKRSTDKEAAATHQKQPHKTPPGRKVESTEPIRLNVRNTLTESLMARVKATDDLKLKDEEITELVLKIELEMYKHFKDAGSKYKAKYRSLIFNIKDTKNLTLFRKIADKTLTPDAVVRLTSDEMASQELAAWREKETKHQLEMIKKNELDLMAQAKSIVVKTHKGEQIIENTSSIDHVDPETSVHDIVSALNNESNDTEKDDKPKDESLKRRDDKKKKDKDRERDRDRSRDKKRHHKSRDRSKTRDRSRDRRSKPKDSKKDKEKDR